MLLLLYFTLLALMVMCDIKNIFLFYYKILTFISLQILINYLIIIFG